MFLAFSVKFAFYKLYFSAYAYFSYLGQMYKYPLKTV